VNCNTTHYRATLIIKNSIQVMTTTSMVIK